MARHRSDDHEPIAPVPGSPAPVGLSPQLLVLTLAIGVATAVILSVLAYYRP